MQVGELVLVKSFPNEPVVRRVFEECDDGVWICLEEDFRLWVDKGIKPQTVRCPKSRLFILDHGLYAKLREAAYTRGDDNLLDSLWNQAQRYYSQDKEAQYVGR